MAQKVKQLCDREAAFWTKAYEENFRRLCSLACGRLTGGNSMEAEEVVSEAFARGMQYAKEPERIENLFAYLWKAAKGVFYVKRRNENTANMESLDEIRDNEDAQARHPMVEPEVLRALETKDLEVEMSREQGPLTPREKRLLTLYLKGYKCHEIAAILKEDKRLTRSDLNAVKTKVRDRLKKAKVKRKAKAKTTGSAQS